MARFDVEVAPAEGRARLTAVPAAGSLPFRSLRRVNSHHSVTSSGPLEASFPASFRSFHEYSVRRVTPSTAASSTEKAALAGRAPAPVAHVPKDDPLSAGELAALLNTSNEIGELAGE